MQIGVMLSLSVTTHIVSALSILQSTTVEIGDGTAVASEKDIYVLNPSSAGAAQPQQQMEKYDHIKVEGQILLGACSPCT